MSGIDLSAAIGAAARAAFRDHCGSDADLDQANANPPVKSFNAETGEFEEIPEGERMSYLTDLWEGWMRSGLTAAAPLIEAAVRAQIAAEIEDLAHMAVGDAYLAIMRAARIARGDS